MQGGGAVRGCGANTNGALERGTWSSPVLLAALAGNKMAPEKKENVN